MGMIAALDGLLFILLVAVAGFLRLLAKKAGETTNPDPPSTTPPRPRVYQPRPPRTADTDEERIRRFMEALGQPPSSKPPEPVTQRPSYQKPIVIQHLPPFRPPFPPLTTRPPAEILQPGPVPPPVAVAPVEDQPVRPAVAEAAVFEIQKGTGAEETAAVATVTSGPELPAVEVSIGESIMSWLRSPADVRKAIVLREILGAPRGLQPFEVARSA